MKTLARHIEVLLRDNDCVILPGFGGFIAHNVPAYYVEDERMYYPPSRSISFNAAITMNDGLLVQSYMKSYQVDYAHASYMVDMAVERLIDTLDEEGCMTLPHIGSFTQDIHQTLQFVPDRAGIASSAHFGLGSYLIKELSQLQQTIEISPKAKTTAAHSGKIVSLHISKGVLHRVLSTAAVFLLLLMVALPTGTHRPTDIASLHLTEILSTPQIQEKTILTTLSQEESITVLQEDEESSATIDMVSEASMEESRLVATETLDTIETSFAAEVPIVEAPRLTITETKPTKTYHIIVASLPNHRGADETLAQYVNHGYANASLVERDDRVRISLVQFADKDEANAYLKTLRQNEKFQGAWLLAIRN